MSASVHAQTISGRIVDDVSDVSVEMVSVILYEYGTKGIVAYTYSNDKGHFEFDVELIKKAYTIEFNHLSYETLSRHIFIEQGSKQRIELNISLISKVENMEEAVVKVTRPIIVKKDTIIYDIASFAKESDQTLEDVMSKIEGIKILENGDIEVEGKKIQKVIIDGKEVFDVGAAVITKSLDPHQVKSIEVRFDEKDTKLKDNLLESDQYVVLDIKLKDDFKQKMFGKLRLTAGYQSQGKLGGYANIFSLKDKVKIHLFTELDDFGKQTITLKHIRNIGDEAMQKIFEIPADFKSITEKENYQEEIYGFKNYRLNEKKILGITSKFEWNKNLNIFFGSYNSYDKIEKSRLFTGVFDDATVFRSNEENSLKGLTSKNKLEFKYDSKKSKLVLNTNWVYELSNFEQTNVVANYKYHFFSDIEKIKNYSNLKFERKISNKVGVEIKSSFSRIKEVPNNKFLHNNSEYSLQFIDADSSQVYNFVQNSQGMKQNFISSLVFQLKSKIGIVELGNTFSARNLKFNSDSYNLSTTAIIPDFSLDRRTYNTSTYRPSIKHRISLGDFVISNTLEYSFVNYQTIGGEVEKKERMNYHAKLNYFINKNFSSKLSYINRLSSFPLNKLLLLKSIIDFQTITTPAASITPQSEEVFEFSASKKFRDSKITITTALLTGRSNTLDLFYRRNDSPLLYAENNQLTGKYTLISTSLTKKTKNGIAFIIEPEYMTNSSQSIQQDAFYTVQTERYLLGVKMKNDTKSKRFNYFLYPKYSKFNFSNSRTNFESNQEMLSMTIKGDYELIQKSLYLSLSSRNVLFFGAQQGESTNVNFSVFGAVKKINWKFLVNNVFNDQQFIQQAITPIIFTTENNVVFGRLFQIAIEYKFY